MRKKVDIWWRETRQRWYADVPTPNGKRKRLNLGPDEQRARAKLYEAMAQYYNDLGESGDGSSSSSSVRRGPYLIELAVQFLEWNKSNRSYATWRTYRDGIKYVTRRFRGKLAADLTPSDVEELKTEMVEGGYRSRTINIMIASLKRMYNWAENHKILPENTLSNLERVSSHVNAPARQVRKDMPLKAALRCIELCRESQPLGDICELLLWTGMRIGEAADLRWGDVDLERQMLTLTKHKTSERTGQPRQIPLCSRVVEIIRNQRTGDITPATHVFQGVNGQPFTRSALQCRLRRLRKSHPELKPFHFHRLRHTCATLLARRNVPERVAQAILGHSSKLMTRYYTATDPSEMIDAVERLSSSAESSRS